MATWTSLGHAMRRRMGAPSNHHEAAGKSMNRNMMTPEEVLASAEHANSARKYVGQVTGVANMSGAPSKGTLMPKKNTQAGDPVGNTKANRVNKLAGNAAQSERMGARYVVGANFPAVHSIEASATMANAKIVPSVMGKNAPDFNYGMNNSY
jgi:hypothetical protein